MDKKRAGSDLIGLLLRVCLRKMTGPFAVHLGLNSAMVLPSSSRVRLDVMSKGPATLSVDGFIDLHVGEGDEVLLEVSPYKARFIRALPPSNYYLTLMKRLGLQEGEPTPRALR